VILLCHSVLPDERHTVTRLCCLSHPMGCL